MPTTSPSPSGDVRFIGLLGSLLASKRSLRHWLLFVIVLAGNAAGVRFAVILNQWNGRFFDALQAMDKQAVFSALYDFIWIASTLIATLVFVTYLKERLKIALRRDLTHIFIDNWMGSESAHFRLRESGKEPDNPDQRLTEDIKGLTAGSVDLAVSFVSSVLTLGSFSLILWELSGSITFFGVTIPGYMFWVCVSYALITTVVTHLIGRNLHQCNITVQHTEADLRTALIEKRTHADAIAGAHGESVERSELKSRLESALQAIIQLVKKQRDLDLFTVGLGQITHLAPIFFALPAFFAGRIALGGLMQLRGAFVDVARSFSWFIFAYQDLARLSAHYKRLDELWNGISAARRDVSRSRIESSGSLRLNVDLCLTIPGSTDQRLIRMALKEGSFALLCGPSGCGKSTLLRTLGGFYDGWSGKLRRAANVFWLPQLTYLPSVTLKQVLSYPKPAENIDDAACSALLESLGLGKFAGRLHESAPWSRMLSGGEQQRLSAARAILAKPELLLMDETTAGLDEPLALSLIARLRKELPETAIILVTHQNFLRAKADCVYEMHQQN